MSKKIMIRSITALALIIGGSAFAWFRFLYTPDYPEGVLYDSNIYLIDSRTILASLEQEETDVFLPAPPEPEEGWPQLWPPGSFAWDQYDYFKIADTLHRLMWNESLEDWHLIRAYFRIDQCQDILGRIDAANLSFYRRLGGVHGFWIAPLYGYVEVGIEYSVYTPWIAYVDTPWATRWKDIELDKVEIRDVDAALAIAEENGGREARLLVKDDCRIDLLLAPDRIEYDFLSHPFTRYGWGWSVTYWPNQSNVGPGPIFDITVDPFTGKYRILTPAR